ncbi:MAG: hypothetical protein LC768_18475 [Acidobacteria bacterium]|nr:hypothetical protein [Acidobacteriota bacterium]MCA1640276.1 hypothetical protein [Acidobacteriota bacterium]
MKQKLFIFLFIFACLIFSTENIFAQNNERVIGPSNWYVKKENRDLDDWYVIFSLPKNARIKQIYSTGGQRDKALLSFSRKTLKPNSYDNKYEVIAGGGRILAVAYTGSISNWAQTLKVRYEIFEPRGPAPPRGNKK